MNYSIFIFKKKKLNLSRDKVHTMAKKLDTHIIIEQKIKTKELVIGT